MPDEKDKPVLDERTFGRLLEAAFVLQEHNRELHKLERNLEFHSDQLQAQELAAPKPSLTILPDPEPEPPTPETAAAEHFSPEPTPPQTVIAESVPVEPLPAAPAAAAPAPRQSAQPAPKSDYAVTLAQIVETQHQIQVRHLELEKAMSLVAERVTEIAQAGGAAIAFLDGNKVRYRGVAGLMTLPAGTEVPVEKALCVASIKTGQVIRCADVNPEFLLDPDECRRRGIQAMIAVPIFHEGGIAGGLELYYATTQAFTEQDVHTCQLMAGLITEALAREEEIGWKKSLASERAVMLEALEKLKPKLAALIDKPAAKDSAFRAAGSRSSGPRGTGSPSSASRSSSATASSAASTFVCRKCGHELVGEEQFCGKCGSRRGNDRDHDRGDERGNDRRNDYEAPSLQSRVSSLWQMQEAIKKSAIAAPANGGLGHADTLAASDPARPERPLADSIEEEMPELFAAPELRAVKMSDPELIEKEFQSAPPANPIEVAAKPVVILPVTPSEPAPVETAVEEAIPKAAVQEHEEEIPSAETALVKPEPVANWSSATTAREFLEQLAGDRPGGLARFWKARRGDIYLAVAVILVAAVIRWGIWSNHSVSATGKPTPAAAAAAHRSPRRMTISRHSTGC